MDSTLITPPPYVDPKNKTKFGKEPPPLIGEEYICPSPVICPTCSTISNETKACKREFTIDDLLGHRPLSVQKLMNVNTKGQNNRTLGKLLHF